MDSEKKIDVGRSFANFRLNLRMLGNRFKDFFGLGGKGTVQLLLKHYHKER